MRAKTQKPRATLKLTAALALAFFVLSALALLVSGSLQLYSGIRAQQEIIASNQQLIAQNAARTVSSFIQEKFSVLETTVKLADPTEATPEEQRQVLQGLLGLQPAFRHLVLLNAQNQILAQASRLSEAAVSQFVNQKITGEALTQIGQHKRYISPIYVDLVSNEPLMIITFPEIDVLNGFEGTLVAEMNLKFTWQLIEQLKIGETGLAYVVDKNGNLIAYRDTARILKGENVSRLKPVSAFIQTPASAGPADLGLYYTGITGATVVGTYVPLGTPDWAVVIEVGWEEAYGEVVRDTLLGSGIVLVIALLTGLVGLSIARRLAAPLVTLTETANRITGGEMDLRAEVGGPQEVVSLAAAFNSMTAQLKQTLAGLEQRVEERTRDLALAAEVGRAVSQVRDLDTLLTQAVELIRARFNLYYVQIYLTDPTGRLLVLRAGTGAVGVELMRRGFRLPIGPGSINGAAAADKRPIIVADTAASPLFRPNSLLPETRSEMVVPLLAGSRVVGVLDIQSDQTEVLTPESLSAFEALAGQLVVAIENAALFTQAETARAEIEKQARRLIHTGWESFLITLQNKERVEYRYEPETAQATEASGAETNALATPIMLTGEQIGTLKLEGAAEWSENEAEIVQAVARQAARQLENIRLLAQAEQYRHEAEQAARSLIRENWADYLAAAHTPPGFAYDGNEVSPLASEATAEAPAAFTAPLTVRDEMIGELSLENVSETGVDAAEIIDSVAAQLSTHIENLRLNQQTRLALAESQALYEISARLNAAGTLEETLHIAARLGVGVNADNAALFIFDLDAAGNPEWMEVRASWAAEGAIALPLGVRFYILSYPLSPIWLNSPDSPVFIEDTQTDARLDDRLRAIFAQSSVRAVVAMPLVLSSNRWIGLITINWAKPHIFSSSDYLLCKSLSSQAATVVDNRLLFAKTQHALVESEQLFEASRRLAAATTLDEVLTTVIESVSIAAVNRAVLLSYEYQGLDVSASVTANWYGGYGTSPTPVGEIYPAETFKTYNVFLMTEPTFFEETETDPRLDIASRQLLLAQSVRGAAVLPLWAGGKQLGVALLESESPHHFSENEIRPLTSLAQQMAIAVENRRLFEQTQAALAESEQLYRAGVRLNAASTPNEILTAIARTALIQGASMAALFSFRLDSTGAPAELEVVSALNEQRILIEAMLGLRYPLTDIAYARYWLKDPSQPFVISDVASDKRLDDKDRAQLADVGALIFLPLTLAGRWIGAVRITWPTLRLFNDKELRLYRSLSTQAATVLDNQLLFRQTQKRAERESIINLINQKIQNATSVESAMQTAVRELGQIFRARRTIIELGASPAPEPENSQ